MKMYDLIVVGSGPAGIFTCLEIIRINKDLKVMLIDQGKAIEKRFCPVSQNKNCVKCKPFCHITSGFSGAGAFSDGKLTLYNEEDTDMHVGGNVHKYIGIEQTKKLINYADQIYLNYGADSKLEGVDYKSEVLKYQEIAQKHNIELVSLPIRHLGTEKAHDVYKAMQDDLISKGIEFKLETQVIDIIMEGNSVIGVRACSSKNPKLSESIYAKKVVIAVGRKGANWLSEMCEKHSIKNRTGIVDIGIRYELPDEVMKDINRIMYEGKFIGKLLPYKDKVRTFCQNPSGFVSSEVYDNGLTLVNGHSYKHKKSNNTNLAILCSHHFTDPFDQPIVYGRNIAHNVNLLADGKILVQRLGDLLEGHRTHRGDLDNNKVIPTLKSIVEGDISHALHYRTLTSILEFIKTMENIIPGFADKDNLLYAPEIKFYSNEVIIDSKFETSVSGLYSIGDAGGLTRGLMQASVSGIYLARTILNKE